MSQTRFNSYRTATQPRRRLWLSGLSFGLSVLCSLPLHAQTAPVLPGANNAADEETAVSDILLHDPLDEDTQGMTTANPSDTLTIVRGKGEKRKGKGALQWSYMLNTDKPARLTIEAGPSIAQMHSVRLWLRTSQPGTVGIFLEDAKEAGAPDTVEPQRYIAYVWSSGNTWQQMNISTQRFIAETSTTAKANDDDDDDDDKPKAAPTPIVQDWSHIARYGVVDASNTWLLRAGQPRISQARQLWIDDIQISSKPSDNDPIPEATPETDAPADKDANDPKAAPANPAPVNSSTPPNPNGLSGPPAGDPMAGPQNPGMSPQNPDPNAPPNSEAPQMGGGEAQPGDPQDADDNEDDTAKVDPAIYVYQDAYGDMRLWTPVNSQTAPAEKGGMNWSFTRLANRTSAIMMATNNTLFTGVFPQLSVRPIPRKPNTLANLGRADRWLRLALEIGTQKQTNISVAITEKGGAVYSMTIPVDPRRGIHRETMVLPFFVNERTSPDTNGQIDLDQIQYISITDVGAQTGKAGPNVISINGVGWAY